jgi:hypothetical protein
MEQHNSLYIIRYRRVQTEARATVVGTRSMKNRAAYHKLVDKTFGTGSATFDSASDDTNEVLGALNCADDFFEFRRNFQARLRRLAAIYVPGHPSRESLLCQVNEVSSSKNWQGAHAELAAYDYFHTEKNWVDAALELNKDIDGALTYAREIGKPGPANHDIWFSSFNVVTDVKCLKDNVAEILEGIYRSVFQNPERRPRIMAQRRMDMSYEYLRDNRAKVINELKQATSAGQQPTTVKSQVVPDLVFRLRWAPGVSMATSAYSSYRHAEQSHQLVFNYVSKFTKDRSSFLTFVNFPWFNNTTTDFGSSNSIFYRSFARRVFCQYRHDARLFSELRPEFVGTESIYDITRKISALLFLEDQSVTEKPRKSSHVRGFLYVNPNADHPLLARAYVSEYFKGFGSTAVDLFEHDNY